MPILKSLKELNKEHIESIDSRLYALGDWCQGPSIQDAWLAGKKLAKHLMNLGFKFDRILKIIKYYI